MVGGAAAVPAPDLDAIIQMKEASRIWADSPPLQRKGNVVILADIEAAEDSVHGAVAPAPDSVEVAPTATTIKVDSREVAECAAVGADFEAVAEGLAPEIAAVPWPKVNSRIAGSGLEMHRPEAPEICRTIDWADSPMSDFRVEEDVDKGEVRTGSGSGGGGDARTKV